MNETHFNELIVKFNGDISKVCRELDAYAEIIDCNYAIVTVPSENISKLYSYKEIEYFEASKTVSALQTLETEMSSAYILPVKSGRYNLNGEGVIICIIDSGIDYTHKEFLNDDGTTRILYIWDQSYNGNPPSGFIYGSEYTSDDINCAIKSGSPLPLSDVSGHGTAVAGIAAGNSGIASKASVIIVKLNQAGYAKSADILRGIKYALDKASAANMPLAVNISYGMNNGSHSGNSLFEQCVDSLCGKWKTSVTAAAGNEGGASHHFSTEISSGEITNAEFVCASSQKNIFLNICKNCIDDIDFELTAPDGSSTGTFFSNGSPKAFTMGNANIFINYRPASHYSMHEEIIVSIETSSSYSAGIWKIIIKCRSSIDGRIDIWLPTVAEIGENAEFLMPDNLNTMTLPATSKNVISAAGYNSLVLNLASFSGKGYDGTTPDITAPAVNIYTAKPGGGYDAYSGTSMAAPFVCGSAALMMEWGIVNSKSPFLYGEFLKAYLIKGALRGNISYPDNGWGYGILNLNRTISMLDNNL